MTSVRTMNATFVAAVVVMAVLCGAVVLADDSEGAVTSYDAVFYLDDGTEYAAVTVTDEDDCLVLPDEPSREGYSFLGWATESGGSVVVEAGTVQIDNPMADATYYAVFEEGKYAVSFVVDGIQIDNPVEGVSNATDIAAEDLPVPSKDGYVFAAWVDADGAVVYSYNYLSGEYAEGYADSGYKFVADTVLYASFQSQIVYVTYIVDGETYYVDAVAYGTVAKPIVAPDGYAWDFDFEDAITADMTVNAVASVVAGWTATFVSDGKVVAVFDAANITLPDDPVLEGYAFAGWSVGNEIIKDPVAYAAAAGHDVTFIAVFTAGGEASAEGSENGGFWSSTTNQAIVFVVICVILVIIYYLWHIDFHGFRTGRSGKKKKDE